jgi:hypothetical protein
MKALLQILFIIVVVRLLPLSEASFRAMGRRKLRSPCEGFREKRKFIAVPYEASRMASGEQRRRRSNIQPVVIYIYKKLNPYNIVWFTLPVEVAHEFLGSTRPTCCTVHIERKSA